MATQGFISSIPLQRRRYRDIPWSHFLCSKRLRSVPVSYGRPVLYPLRHGASCSLEENVKDSGNIEELKETTAFDEPVELTPDELELCGQFPPDITMINKVILVGRLGRDPEIRQVGNDLQVCRFSLAVPNEYDPDEGDDQEKTSWFDVEAWGRMAQYIVASSRKGMRVGITGSFGMNQWTGKDGEERQNYIVTAESFEVLQSRSERSESVPNERGYADSFAPSEGYKQQKRVEEREEFIDLPF